MTDNLDLIEGLRTATRSQLAGVWAVFAADGIESAKHRLEEFTPKEIREAIEIVKTLDSAIQNAALTVLYEYDR